MRPTGGAHACAYYNAPGGCSRGARCTFRHEGQEGVGVAVRPVLTPAAVDQRKAKKDQPTTAGNVHAQLLRPAPIAPAAQHYDDSAAPRATLLGLESDPVLSSNVQPSLLAAAAAAHGLWTRGTPYAPKPTFVPAATKPVRQLQPPLPRPPSATVATPVAAANGDVWSTVQRTRPKSAAPTTTAAAASPPTAAAASASQSRGMLILPRVTVLQTPSNANPMTKAPPTISTGQKASVKPSSSSHPRPHVGWSLADRLDLASLKKLDAITAGRPIGGGSTRMDASDHASFPALPTAAAWATSTAGSAGKKPGPLTSALKSTAATTASSSSARLAHSASHKPSSKISFSATTTSSSSAASSKKEKTTKERLQQQRPRSATVKSKRESASAAATADGLSSSAAAAKKKKPPKPTHLKKALIHERVQLWAKEIVTSMIRTAIGEPPVPTLREREQQLAELTRRVKKATYDARQAELAIERARAREEKARIKEQAKEERARLQQEAKETKLLAKSTASTMHSIDVPPSSSTEPPSAEPAPSAPSTRRLMAPLLPPPPMPLPSSPAVAIPRPADESLPDAADSSSSDEEEQEADAGEESNEEQEDGDDDENESEFVAAPALPSEHLVAHFPSATPPVVATTSSNTAASSGPVAASGTPAVASAAAAVDFGVRTLRSLAIPSTLKLSSQEQALLNWQFQSQHHGHQPRLVGACARHCHQMFRRTIDDLVWRMLTELHHLHARARDRDPLRAAQKLRYVSGLKQTWKLVRAGRIRCVVVAGNIEANEAAGGLDDLLDDILGQCQDQRIPIVFALTRVKLGRALSLANTASCVGLLDYSGCGDEYKQLLTQVKEAQEEWSMFQCDTWLNPRPPGYEEQARKDEARLAAKSLERRQKKEAHEKQVALADDERRAYMLAQRTGADGVVMRKKKKTRGKGDARDLQPLPAMREEDDAKGRRRKGGKRGKKLTETDRGAMGAASAASSSTAAQLKGAGKALSAIAEAMAEPEDDKKKAAGGNKKPPTAAAAAAGKSNKKDEAKVAPSLAEEHQGKKSHKGKSDKKPAKGKSRK